MGCHYSLDHSDEEILLEKGELSMEVENVLAIHSMGSSRRADDMGRANTCGRMGTSMMGSGKAGHGMELAS